MEYYTEVEIAKMLGLSVSIIKKLDIHKCPEGYSLYEVEKFCAHNGIEMEDRHPFNAIGVLENPPKDNIVRWYNSPERALMETNHLTRVFMSEDEDLISRLFGVCAKEIKLILVQGDDDKNCHINAKDWQEAIMWSKRFLQSDR